MVESWHYTLTKVAASPSIIKEAWIRIIDTDPASASLQSFIDQTLKLTKAKVGGVVKLRQNNTCCCCHNKNFLQTSDKPFGIKINQRVDQQAQGCCMALPRTASSRSGRSTFCHKTSVSISQRRSLSQGETFAWFLPFSIQDPVPPLPDLQLLGWECQGTASCVDSVWWSLMISTLGWVAVSDICNPFPDIIITPPANTVCFSHFKWVIHCHRTESIGISWMG